MEQREDNLPATVEKDGSDIEVQTGSYDVSIGYDRNLVVGQRLSKWDGLRIKSPDNDAVYLVDQGLKRLIPNATTFNNLFRNWSHDEVIDIDSITTGESIPDGAVLARASGTAGVYLIDRNVKRSIVSPAVMDKYNFNWDTIYQLPPRVIDDIPTGEAIT